MAKELNASKIWYKARSNDRNEKCCKCEKIGIYWLEPAFYILEENNIKDKYFDSGYRCEDHITEDMLNVIERWDHGEALLNVLKYEPLSFRQKLFTRAPEILSRHYQGYFD